MKIITGALPTAYAVTAGEFAIHFSNGVTVAVPGTPQISERFLRLDGEQVKYERAELLAFYDVPSDAVETVKAELYGRTVHVFRWYEVTV